MITIALSKGRLLKEAIPLLQEAGFPPTQSPDDTRQLIIPSTVSDIQFLVLRSSDVPTFVRHGAAQLGIAGKDILIEQACYDLFQPCDLAIGYCRLSLAAKKTHSLKDLQPHSTPLRIATKYPRITQQWFAKRQQSVQLIKLYGSMEIAPTMGLADAIVDLVSSGATLRENHLHEVEVIESINARLIVNRASLKTQHAKIKPIIEIFSTISTKHTP